jgi:hypothetical protein
MTAKNVLEYALPLGRDFSLELRDQEIILYKKDDTEWVSWGNLGLRPVWKQLVSGRFRTPFDLNYTLRSLGAVELNSH